jgi:hypothetical protein
MFLTLYTPVANLSRTESVAFRLDLNDICFPGVDVVVGSSKALAYEEFGFLRLQQKTFTFCKIQVILVAHVKSSGRIVTLPR